MNSHLWGQITRRIKNDPSRSVEVLRQPITSMDGLCDLPSNVIEISKDGGNTWKYALLGNEPFLQTDGEIAVWVFPDAQSGGPAALTEKMFESGWVTRAALPIDVADVTFVAGLEPRYGHGDLTASYVRGLRMVRDGVGLPDTVSEASAVAARWWADQLRGTGENVVGGFRGLGLSTYLHEKWSREDAAELEEASIERFEDNLARRIEAMQPAVLGKKIGTDYDPDLILGLAARAAGIPDSLFPFKVTMTVTPSVVEVRGRTIWASQNADAPGLS